MVAATASFLLLVGLELVLGIDNIIMVGMVSHRVKHSAREATRKAGIILAAVGRLVLLTAISSVMALTRPILAVGEFNFSWKDIILLAGGAFLLFKAVKELHMVVVLEPLGESEESLKEGHISVGTAVAQICALDLVFSIDSIVTAVGVSNSLPVMCAAVIAASIAILAISGPIIRFVQKHPSLKVLALSFLVVIGCVICIEGLGQHIDKTYVYLPMGFCLAVELLQMIRTKNTTKKPNDPA